MLDIPKGKQLLDKQVGKPYVFGYEVKLVDLDPIAFDCSELVEWFYHQMDVRVPDGSWHQYTQSSPVADPRPFDVNFLLKNGKTPFHVVLMYDDQTIVHAKGEKYGVVKESNDYLARNAKIASGWRRFKVLLNA